MKVTLKEIWTSQRALGKLSKISPLPIKTSYWVAKRTKIISKEVESIEEKRLELVKKYGEEVSGSKQGDLTVPDDKMEIFVKEFNDLLNVEVELNMEKFNLEEFAGNINISGEDMILLSFLFNEPVESVKPPMPPMPQGR